jgi:hypothetical protein
VSVNCKGPDIKGADANSVNPSGKGFQSRSAVSKLTHAAMVNTLGKFVNKTVDKNTRYMTFSLDDVRHFLCSSSLCLFIAPRRRREFCAAKKSSHVTKTKNCA